VLTNYTNAPHGVGGRIIKTPAPEYKFGWNLVLMQFVLSFTPWLQPGDQHGF
jgi:hypothetical protein